ncbi:metal-dependent hydrolase [Desulfobacterales bacterium HSG2]|nr:metal-dependent hydrolase [Desulfobacterales bacterium HSG2]
MPSVVTHTVVGIAAGKIFANEKMPARFWILSVFCAVVPDADVIGFYLGVPYGHFFGHRGFFHSPFFGLILSLLIVTLFFSQEKTFSKSWLLYALYFFLTTASHGVLDAFTNGGLGIALLSPFDNTRYFFPWTPIRVSPLSLEAFLSERGVRVIASEVLWVWVPVIFLVALCRERGGMAFSLRVKSQGQ